MPSPELGAGPESNPTSSLSSLLLDMSFLDSIVGHPTVRAIIPTRRSVMIMVYIFFKHLSSYILYTGLII